MFDTATDPYLAPFGSGVPIPKVPRLGLDAVPTGRPLEAALRTVGPARSDDQAVEILEATARLANAAQAQLLRAVADVADRCPYMEYAHLEIATALRYTRRAAERLTHLAWDVVHRLPNLLALMDQGRVDLPRARVLSEEVVHLSDDDARAVVDELADRVDQLTTGQLRAAARKVALAIDPDAAEERYEHSVEERGVELHQTSDGTGTIEATGLPPDKAAAAMAHINACARGLKASGDARTMDQLRADVLCDLLTGNGEAVSTNVTFSIDSDVLIALATGEGDGIAVLDGWGPVIADVARQALEQDPEGTWRVKVTDPDSHRSLTSVATRRRPTAAQRRAVMEDVGRCVFPGCRMPAADCDIDHRVRVTDDGPTLVENLAPLCTHHHRAKDEGGWRYEPTADGGYT